MRACMCVCVCVPMIQFSGWLTWEIEQFVLRKVETDCKCAAYAFGQKINNCQRNWALSRQKVKQNYNPVAYFVVNFKELMLGDRIRWQSIVNWLSNSKNLLAWISLSPLYFFSIWNLQFGADKKTATAIKVGSFRRYPMCALAELAIAL